MVYRLWVLVFLVVLFVPDTLWSAHPLITDDTGTQGKAGFQIEINGQYDTDKETETGVSVKSTGWQIGTTLSYGLVDNADIVLNLLYLSMLERDNGTVVVDEKGLSDISLELKWRFYESGDLSMAVKPGAILPIGDEDRGLGAGKTGYHLFLIGTREAAPWAFHANLGYIRNENDLGENENIWHASLATMYEPNPNINLVGNIGVERNPEVGGVDNPAFLIIGAIYSISQALDVSGGVKAGLSSSETDMSVMAGLAYRF